MMRRLAPVHGILLSVFIVFIAVLLLAASASPPERPSIAEDMKNWGKVKRVQFDLGAVLNLPNLRSGMTYVELQRTLQEAGLHFEGSPAGVLGAAPYEWQYRFCRKVHLPGFSEGVDFQVTLTTHLQALAQFEVFERHPSRTKRSIDFTEFSDAEAKIQGVPGAVFTDLQRTGMVYWFTDSLNERLVVMNSLEGKEFDSETTSVLYSNSFLVGQVPTTQPRHRIPDDYSEVLGLPGLKTKTSLKDAQRILSDKKIGCKSLRKRQSARLGFVNFDIPIVALLCTVHATISGLEASIPSKVTLGFFPNLDGTLFNLTIQIPGSTEGYPSPATCRRVEAAFEDEFGTDFTREESTVSRVTRWGSGPVMSLWEIGGSAPHCILQFDLFPGSA
ncbi:MAG: hypothetical protein ACREJQ_04120 [bacterium]